MVLRDGGFEEFGNNFPEPLRKHRGRGTLNGGVQLGRISRVRKDPDRG
jgi:hypothetical protein